MRYFLYTSSFEKEEARKLTDIPDFLLCKKSGIS